MLTKKNRSCAKLCDTPRCSSRTVLTYCDHRQAALFYALTYRKRHALRVEEYNGNDVGSWVLRSRRWTEVPAPRTAPSPSWQLLYKDSALTLPLSCRL